MIIITDYEAMTWQTWREVIADIMDLANLDFDFNCSCPDGDCFSTGSEDEDSDETSESEESHVCTGT